MTEWIDTDFSIEELNGILPENLVPEGADNETRLTITAKYLYSEYLRLQRKLSTKEQQVQELAIEKLLWGDVINHLSPGAFAEKYGLNMDDGVFLLVLSRIPGAGSSENMAAKSILDGLLSHRFKLSHFNSRGENIILISAGKKHSCADAFDIVFDACRQACISIEDRCRANPIICISNPVDNAESLRTAFQTLMDMREYAMSLPSETRILTIDDFPNYAPADPDSHQFMTMSVEKQYINAVIAHEFDVALQLTKDKINFLLEDNISGRRTLKPFIESRIEATVDLLMVTTSAVSVGGSSIADDLAIIKETQDLNRIIAQVESIFSKLDSFFNHSDSEIKGTAGKVIRFVASNYQNPALSVEIICDEMGKSRSYLSRMFKESTGMNLLDYLHTTRISEAKRLLTESGLSVAEIGEKVGYYSGWTLARVFKRYEGITPSAYRDAYRQSDE